MIARMYDERLTGISGIQLVKRPSDSVCHLYILRAKRRERLRNHLKDAGIATGVHYPVPLHLQPAFQAAGQKRGDLPHAEQACREIVSLPIHPFLSDSQVETIAESVRKFYS
jgi:dTDP-4-amino-4,6-dideoxygalactose transaminase